MWLHSNLSYFLLGLLTIKQINLIDLKIENRWELTELRGRSIETLRFSQLSLISVCFRSGLIRLNPFTVLSSAHLGATPVHNSCRLSSLLHHLSLFSFRMFQIAFWSFTATFLVIEFANALCLYFRSIVNPLRIYSLSNKILIDSSWVNFQAPLTLELVLLHFYHLVRLELFYTSIICLYWLPRCVLRVQGAR
jgi:hypothetical protein